MTTKSTARSDSGGEASSIGKARRPSQTTSSNIRTAHELARQANLNVPTRTRRHSNENGSIPTAATGHHPSKAMTANSSPSSPNPSLRSGKAKAVRPIASAPLTSEQVVAQAVLWSQAGYSASVASGSSAAIHNINPLSQAHQLSKAGNPVYLRQPFTQMPSLQHTYTLERFSAELTNCVIAFLSPILPTEEEYRMKEVTRRHLERLAQTVSPGAKLLMFGSNSNGFALRSSDMDLCCLLQPDERSRNASDLVEALGTVLRQETDYSIMTLPKARIPIIKIRRSPSADMPYDLSCDIGFENRLALENTRLLLSYAMVDPPRLRTLVLFLKVWAKRRKLNSPFTGTLSSYGYTLMMLYFLIHVKRPAVLPNLQRLGPPTETMGSSNTYFYDDVATLRKEWTSSNTENVGELMMEFFRFFAKDFAYSREVISIRSETGTFAKDHHTWNADLCIEDPFGNYNVARPVTKDGLYTIRGEFIRASRILSARTDRVSAALAELCEEREDSLTRAPEPSQYQRYQRNGGTGLHVGQYDPRYLRDLTRRLEAGMMFNKGGSFAFEEMARGLAQAQLGALPIPCPPTTAMLAPLSQNGGLVKNGLMRAGLRYDANQMAPPQSIKGNASVPNTPRIPSSARSEPSYARKISEGEGKAKTSAPKGNSGNISMQSSPRLLDSIVQMSSSPEANPSYGVGEAFAFGSEITFGSQRFHLYPQESIEKSNNRQERAKSNADLLSPNSAAHVTEAQTKSARSFSEGLNRSMSLPRQASGIERRSSTPAAGDPSQAITSQQNHTTAAHVNARRSSDAVSLRTVSERGSSSGPLERAPFLTAAPWTFVAPGVHASATTKSATSFDGRDPNLLDDDYDFRTSASDGTGDDLARASLLESSTGAGLSDGDEAADDSDLPSEGAYYESVSASPRKSAARLAIGRADDVVAWAVSQREEIERRQCDRD